MMQPSIPVLKAALSAFFLFMLFAEIASAQPLLSSPPLGESCFVISANDETSGFACQRTVAAQNGYLVESFGSTNMKIMGFTREALFYERYLVDTSLKLQSFKAEQRIKGKLALVSGKAEEGGLSIRHKTDGKSTDKLLAFKGALYPAPLLNMLPLLQSEKLAEEYQLQFFDTEDMKIKTAEFSVIEEEEAENGQTMIKMENNLYPFVSNEIWMDEQGNTLLESVRDGLVITKAINKEELAGELEHLPHFTEEESGTPFSFTCLACKIRLLILGQE